jgi:hypothetical protein
VEPWRRIIATTRGLRGIRGGFFWVLLAMSILDLSFQHIEIEHVRMKSNKLGSDIEGSRFGAEDTEDFLVGIVNSPPSHNNDVNFHGFT